MGRRSAPRLPIHGKFFLSLGEYSELAGVEPQLVNLYTKDPQGVWYVNGLKTPEFEIPDDLCEVRMVQR